MMEGGLLVHAATAHRTRGGGAAAEAAGQAMHGLVGSEVQVCLLGDSTAVNACLLCCDF